MMTPRAVDSIYWLHTPPRATTSSVAGPPRVAWSRTRHVRSRPCTIVPPPSYEVHVVPELVRQTMDDLLADVAAKTDKRECDLADWQILKNICAEANERYERDELAPAAQLLNAALHECRRILSILPDPSLLFEPEQQPVYDCVTPTQERLYPFRDWTLSHSNLRSASSSSPMGSPQASSPELPTAFHALLGTALFLLGNIVDRDADIVLSQSAQREQVQPAIAYWLAALDVFETAESLPTRSGATNEDSEKEDWRMALVWGRTLVSLARAQLALTRDDPFARLPIADPHLPRSVAKGSIFTAVAAMRPPGTRRASLSRADAAELLLLAQDHFMRGILHMPHPQAIDAPVIPGPTHERTDHEFSRARELGVVGMEMLSAVERLRVPAERAYWARQADFHLEQMRVEKRGTGPSPGQAINLKHRAKRADAARGRCWLIVGRTHIGALVGETGGLETRDAKKAREALGKAIAFFEQVIGSDATEVHSLYTEALLSLASLTQDEGTREGLYARVALWTALRSAGPDAVNLDGL